MFKFIVLLLLLLMSGQVMISRIMVGKMPTCDHSPAIMKAVQTLFEIQLLWLKHQIHQKQILKCFWQILACIHFAKIGCHQGFFASHLRVQHFPIFVIHSLLALLCCQSHSTQCNPATQLPWRMNWNCSLMLTACQWTCTV